MNIKSKAKTLLNLAKTCPFYLWSNEIKSRNLDFSMKNYDSWFKANRVNAKQLEEQKNNKFKYNPLISILVPLYNTPENFLREMIQCIIDQSYGNWELCLADGSTEEFNLYPIIEEYIKLNNRVKYKKLENNSGISGNTNECLSMATGDYIALFDHDDLLEPNALYEYVSILQGKSYDCLYCDEDLVSEDTSVFYGPNIKPDWSPDLFNAHNYITHFFVVKKSIIDKVGGFDSEYDGAQDYDFISRCIYASKFIFHIPKILYHWRAHQASTAGNSDSKKYAYDAGCRVVDRNVKNEMYDSTVKHGVTPGFQHIVYEFPQKPKVCVLIYNTPRNFNKNQYLELLKSKFDYDNLEIYSICVKDNLYKFANQIINETDSEYCLLLDYRIQASDNLAFGRLLGPCLRDNVSAVSGRILYKDLYNQFCGIIFDKDLNICFPFKNAKSNDPCYMSRPLITCNYSSLTLGCCIIKVGDFKEIGGFDCSIKSKAIEIDLFLKLRVSNKYLSYSGDSLWNSNVEIFKDNYNNNDSKNVISKYSDYFIAGDPFYSPMFSKNRLYTL